MNFDSERRRFLRKTGEAVLGLAGLYALSQIPIVYGETLTIPKLGYAPTIDKLISDYSLQEQMLHLDMKNNSSAPTTAKAAVGFDDTNLDFVLAHTTQFTPITEYGEIQIDAKPGDYGIDTDDFYVNYTLNAQDNSKTGRFYKGQADGNWSSPGPLPSGFRGDARLAKSYFDQQTDHMVFAMQIPNSYVGTGSTGNYGMSFAIFQPNASAGPGYPFDAADVLPQTWGIFSTQYPIPEFPSPQIVAGGTILALPFLIAKLRRDRMLSKK
jgi:hypothetical protein